jgi:hypothetical protein
VESLDGGERPEESVPPRPTPTALFQRWDALSTLMAVEATITTSLMILASPPAMPTALADALSGSTLCCTWDRKSWEKRHAS